VLALAGCAGVSPGTLPSVSVVNSLTFDNAMSGKRDGLRSTWPAATLSGSSEHFPMAQVKQCDKDGAACSWGVLKAHRSFAKARVTPGGMEVDFEVLVDVDRSHQAKTKDQDTTMTIPANVSALQRKRLEKRTMVLAYGKPARIEFGYGINYDVCAQRLDAQGKPLDQCEIG
jgi:hypothetical protein